MTDFEKKQQTRVRLMIAAMIVSGLIMTGYSVLIAVGNGLV